MTRSLGQRPRLLVKTKNMFTDADEIVEFQISGLHFCKAYF